MTQPTLSVLDAAGATRSINTANPNGQALMVDSQPVVLASNQSAVPVSGSVTVSNLPATQPVSIASMPTTAVTGTFWPTTQPVSMATTPGLTDTQLRASAVQVTQSTIPTATGAAETDRSGTVTTGGTAQTIMAANAARKYFELQNLDAANVLYFRKDGTAAVVGAAGSFALAAGSFYSGQATGAVSVISATTGHKFSAVEA